MGEFLYAALVEGKQDKGGVILLLWVLPLIAYLIDFITGVEAAKAVGEKRCSYKFRKTFAKILPYSVFQIFAVLVDIVGSFLPFYNLPYISMLATVCIILIEFKSVRENFEKMKSDNVIQALNLSEKLIFEMINVKDKKSALKIFAKVISGRKDEKENKNEN